MSKIKRTAGKEKVNVVFYSNKPLKWYDVFVDSMLDATVDDMPIEVVSLESVLKKMEHPPAIGIVATPLDTNNYAEILRQYDAIIWYGPAVHIPKQNWLSKLKKDGYKGKMMVVMKAFGGDYSPISNAKYLDGIFSDLDTGIALKVVQVLHN